MLSNLNSYRFTNYLLLFTILITHGLGSGIGYVLESNQTNIYYPTDVCLSADMFSWKYTCYNGEIYDIIYNDIFCDGTIIWNSTVTVDEYDCGDNVTYHYLQHTEYPPFIDCNDLDQKPNSFAEIINECLYDPVNDLYKMDTCTDYIWSTTTYSDEDCNQHLAITQLVDDCIDASSTSYHDITTCTQPLNRINNECGYVQHNKDSFIVPLDECTIISNEFSYLWTCEDDRPYVYIWNSNACDPSSLSTADGGGPMTPITWSCSTDDCNYAVLKNYTNNDCFPITNQDPYTSIAMVTDECFNVMNSDNTLESTMYLCQDSVLELHLFSGPDCNDEDYVGIVDYLEDCSNDIDHRYVIQCYDNSTIITTTSTSTSTSTTTTTTSAPTTSAPTTSMPTTSTPTTSSSTTSTTTTSSTTSTTPSPATSTTSITSTTATSSTESITTTIATTKHDQNVTNTTTRAPDRVDKDGDDSDDALLIALIIVTIASVAIITCLSIELAVVCKKYKKIASTEINYGKVKTTETEEQENDLDDDDDEEHIKHEEEQHLNEETKQIEVEMLTNGNRRGSVEIFT